MKITRREEYVLYAGALITVTLFVVWLVALPILDKRDRLKKTLRLRSDTITEMLIVKSDYDKLKAETKSSQAGLKGRRKGFKLLSHLSELSEKAKIKENIKSMKPSPSSGRENSPFKTMSVQMNIKAVTMKQLTPFLHLVETSRNLLFIKRISIKKKSKIEGVIDALLQVETFEMKITNNTPKK